MIYSGIDDIAKRFLDISSGLSPEVISSLIVMGILALLSFYIAIRARYADPLKKPKGILFLAETGVKFFDGLVEGLMGKRFDGFGGIIMAVACYLFISFIFGLTGLPSPTTNLAIPLSLGLVAFSLIHFTSAKYTKFKYFKRYIDPIPVMLPINLISMWAPLLSLTFRLFGNAIAGYTLMSLIYWALESAGQSIFAMIPNGWGGAIIAPIVTPVLHCYFDLFSGFIQTTVFLFLSMIFIANEAPEEDIDEISMKGGK